MTATNDNAPDLEEAARLLGEHDLVAVPKEELKELRRLAAFPPREEWKKDISDAVASAMGSFFAALDRGQRKADPVAPPPVLGRPDALTRRRARKLVDEIAAKGRSAR